MKSRQNVLACAAMLFTLGVGLPALAATDHEDEREHETNSKPENQPSHFEGQPAKTDEQARQNLKQYNAKLRSLLDKQELSASDLGEIHRISYTLENAVQQLDPEVDWIAEYLEAVHLASERTERDTVRKKGRAYLAASEGLVAE